MEYESVILVTRGDELPKKNFEKKLHPTYECVVRLKNSGTNEVRVIKFFDQYRSLSNELLALGVGENQKFHIDSKFPPSQSASMFGISMSEEALQQRCYLLNKWMGAVLVSYHLLPNDAKILVAKFLSPDNDDDVVEANKNKLLDLIQKKKSDVPKHTTQPSSSVQSSSTETNTPSSHSNNSKATPTPVVTPTSQPAPTPVAAAAPEPDREPTPSVAGTVSPPDNRRGSTMGRRTSTSSTAEGVYSALELEVMGKENVFNSFLAVQITQGEMMPKRPEESKLHVSYQTLLRVLPFEEFNVPHKSDMDADAYNQILTFIAPLRVTKTFDSYRNLKENLEKAGVFSSEVKDPPEGSIVLDAPFPKTYAKSVMGFVLSDNQIAQRVAMLNNWMSRVLAAYCTVSGSAQSLINTFFGIASHIPSDVHYEIFLKMLQKNFTPVRKPSAHQHQPEHNSVASKFSLFKSSSTNAPPPPPAAATSATPAAAPPAVSDAYSVVDPDEDYQDGGRRQSTVTTVFNQNELSDMSKEQIIKSFLAVNVVRGEKLEDNKKVHRAYKTVLRILKSSDVLGYDMSEVDLALYSKYSSMANNSTLEIFDKYRSLKTQLQTIGVFSQDTASQAPKNKKCVIVNAAFPKTYPKSKLGIGLTEAELTQRGVLLNHWMCTLLSLFSDMPEQAQEAIIQFLSLDEDNPAEPQNRVIQQMLRGTFKPPKKVVVAVSSTNGKSKSGGNNAGNSSGVNSKYLQGEDQDDDDTRGRTTIGAGGKGQCCVMM